MRGRREAQQAPRSVGFSPLSLLPWCGLLLGCVAGCGGGLPLLHPAQTLRLGDVRALAGFSSNVAVGALSSATRNAVNEAAGNPNAPTPGDVTYAQGALVAASIGPGLAPIAGARVGIGSQSEAGLVYTGRAVRADIRHSFELSDTWAISVGAGGSAALYGRDEQSSVPNVDLGRLHGWGADVPVLIGYESDGDLYMLWMGARGGWEHVDVDDLTSEPGSGQLGTPPITLSATRFWGGGLVGAAVGFRHVHVAMELDVSYASVSGDYDDTHAHVAGLTLAPAAALWWLF
jgi:hypothetical protein